MYPRIDILKRVFFFTIRRDENSRGIYIFIFSFIFIVRNELQTLRSIMYRVRLKFCNEVGGVRGANYTRSSS